MAGLYFHIPFCKQACHYCDFYFSTTAKYQEELINSMVSEIALHEDWEYKKLHTIYFGGGTPSLLSTRELSNLIDAVGRNFEIDTHAEISLEANPDDLTKKKLIDFKSQGINRLSVGIQSFNGKSLEKINRAHSARQAHEAIQLAMETGFSNLSADLIYGLPGSTSRTVKKDLVQLLEYQIPHISIYGLTVEHNTVFGRWVKKGRIVLPDNDEQAEQMEMIMELMDNHGYIQYEVSNFCKPGYESRHNSAYWKGVPYLGIGPSAHSFDGTNRWFNINNNSRYLKSIARKEIPRTMEFLTSKDRLNDYILTSIRTIDGCDLTFVKEQWHLDLREHNTSLIDRWIEMNYLTFQENKLALTKEGRLIADEIAYQLFL